MKPDDKPKKKQEIFEDPKLFVVIGEKSFPRSGLETAFMDYSNINTESTEIDTKSSGTTIHSGTVVSSDTIVSTKLSSRCLCFFVTTTICTCNKMRPTCNCVGYVRNNNSTTITTGCRCAPVH